MRSRLFFHAILFVSATCFSEASTVFDKPAFPATVASPAFSDPLQYNSYDFCGSPLGLFDRDSLRLRLDLATHLIRWHAAEQNDSLVQRYAAWNLPDLLIGVPNIFYVRLYYSPMTIVADFPGMVPAERTSFPMQAFGLTLACQIPSGYFQFAFQGKGYYGDASTESNQDTRLIMGLDDLSLTVGSRIHELAAIGMQGGVSARFDSLRDMSFPVDYERSFEGQIPSLGWYIDFGTAGFPVQSTVSLNTATCRQVYFSGFDRDPIKGDSIAWKWQTAGDLSSGGCVYHPSLLLGYWRNHYQRFAPTEENDDLTVGPLREGWDWKFSNFYFGIGASADILSIASAWVEFTRSTMGLEYGEYWKLSAQTDKNQSYYSTNVGIEVKLHEISALRFPSSTQTFLRLGFLNRTLNSGIDPFQSREFGKIIHVPSGSRDYRYRPDKGFGWGPTERTTGLVIGLGNSFLNGMIESDAHLSFFGRSLNRHQNGFEFGIDLAYALRP
jgi:hypothetical protein